MNTDMGMKSYDAKARKEGVSTMRAQKRGDRIKYQGIFFLQRQQLS